MTEKDKMLMIEKRKTLIGDIQKFSTDDGPGIRSTVFLKGCPLKCAWCHNPEMIDPMQQMIISPSRCIGCRTCMEVCPEGGITVDENGPSIDFAICKACGKCAEVCFAKAITPVASEMSVEDVMAKVLQDKEFYENSGGGVTVSGGELLLHEDFVRMLIDACADHEIKVCLDTCGYGDGAVLMELALKENVEFILYDIKHMDSEKHKELTGIGNEVILENLRRLAADPRTHDKIWIRMPLVKDVNDGDWTIAETAGLMKELGLHRLSLLKYHGMGIAKARNTGSEYQRFEAPTEDRMKEIEKYFDKGDIV